MHAIQSSKEDKTLQSVTLFTSSRDCHIRELSIKNGNCESMAHFQNGLTCLAVSKTPIKVFYIGTTVGNIIVFSPHTHKWDVKFFVSSILYIKFAIS